MHPASPSGTDVPAIDPASLAAPNLLLTGSAQPQFAACAQTALRAGHQIVLLTGTSGGNPVTPDSIIVTSLPAAYNFTFVAGVLLAARLSARLHLSAGSHRVLDDAARLASSADRLIVLANPVILDQAGPTTSRSAAGGPATPSTPSAPCWDAGAHSSATSTAAPPSGCSPPSRAQDR
jgi:hypothetical protein